MGPLIVIVADDLTGAADCGAGCIADGLSTVVVLGEASRARGLAAEVIAFDAETRRLTPDAAGQATELAVRELCATGGVRVVYKKFDSTLRGNFAREIAATRHACRGWLAHGKAGDAASPVSPLAIIAPAFPAAGRTTRGGRVFLHGEPLEASEVWRNEGMSGVANVSAMLREQGNLHTETMGLETIRTDAGTLTALLARHADAGVAAVVCDAETDDDLSAIAHAAAHLRGPVVLAGSTGLMRYVPQAFRLAKKRGSSLARDPAPRPGYSISHSVTTKRAPLLFVIGSRSQVSREQLRLLSAESGVRTFTVPPATLRSGPDSVAWREAARQLKASLGGNHDVALALELGEKINLGESEFLSRALAQLLLPSVGRLGGLCCTGGDTAIALLTAAGAAGIRLAGEVEPGVPRGTVEGLHDLPIVTKAGAFGSPQALVRSRAALHRVLAPPTQA